MRSGCRGCAGWHHGRSAWAGLRGRMRPCKNVVHAEADDEHAAGIRSRTGSRLRLCAVPVDGNRRLTTMASVVSAGGSRTWERATSSLLSQCGTRRARQRSDVARPTGLSRARAAESGTWMARGQCQLVFGAAADRGNHPCLPLVGGVPASMDEAKHRQRGGPN